MEYILNQVISAIDNSFLNYTGQRLPTPDLVLNRNMWIKNNAPYCILSHDLSGNLKFINQSALELFDYTEQEMLEQPSSCTAENGQERENRTKLLQLLQQKGIIYNIFGERVTRSGNHFNIYDGIVWQVESEEYIGQAGLVWGDSKKRPNWFNLGAPQ